MGKLFDEMKRRNVVRVGVAYIVVGWLTAQVAELVLPTFGAPDWVLRTLLVLIALGLPFALLFAWAFELTSQGLKRTAEVDASDSIAHSTGRKLDFVIIAVLVVALGYFVWESRFETTAETTAAATTGEVTETQGQTVASLAVLPFVSFSSDQEQSWFADGLTEEILNSLVRIPDLLVAARTSSFAFKGSDRTIPDIASELGVSHILEGSVRRAGDRIRVTAQLIRADDGFHLWSENYDRDIADLIVIQEDVAIEIAGALKTAMDPQALARMVSAGTRSVEAYELYLGGLARFRESGETGDKYLLLEAQESFEQAVSIDPEFSDAHEWLAQFWIIQLSPNQVNYGITDFSKEEIKARFDAAIDNAIRTETHPADRAGKLAFRAINRLELQDALRYNTEFLAARPNDMFARGQQMGLLMYFGRYDEVVDAAQQALSLDLDSLGFSTDLTFAYLWGGTAEEIRAVANEELRRYPNQALVMYQSHRGLLWAGDIDGASRLVPIIEASDLDQQNKYLANLRQACAERRVEDAQRLVKQMEDSGNRSWVGYMILGDKEAATEFLRPLDDPADLTALSSYLNYGSFDPRPFPNLMALLEREGVDRGEPVEIPYRCTA